MPFSIPEDMNSEYNTLLHQLQISNWQPWWIATWKSDATVRQYIESSNQAFEYVKLHPRRPRGSKSGR